MLVHKADPHAAHEIAHLQVLLTGFDRGRGKSVNLAFYAIEISEYKRYLLEMGNAWDLRVDTVWNYAETIAVYGHSVLSPNFRSLTSCGIEYDITLVHSQVSE